MYLHIFFKVNWPRNIFAFEFFVHLNDIFFLSRLILGIENEKNSSFSICKTEHSGEDDIGFDHLEPESLKFDNPKLIRIKQKYKVKRNRRDKKIEIETKKAKYDQAINAVKR